METRILCALLVSSALALTACGKKTEPAPAPAPAPAVEPAPAPEPAGVSIASVSTGSAIGSDKKVTVAGDSFAPTDTMYVSIDTTGSGPVTLGARWTYVKGGNVAVVKEDSLAIEATGPATNEFHVSKPDGWPAGNYEVEVTLDGMAVSSKALTVK